MKNYYITDLTSVPPVNCPCGSTQRAFTDEEDSPASIHLVDISKTSRLHYHKKMTEIYLILEGEGHMELDGELIPVKPMMTLMIKPGCRHRAIGNLKIVNIPIPAFIKEDEYFD
jgi:mannose-6-phosphate isomerase-like protein (cupin superfamily)